MGDILDANGQPIPSAAEAKEAARQALAAKDPGWWSDMGGKRVGKDLIPIRGHFFRLAEIGPDGIKLKYVKPCKKNRR